ncbi:hypothetical protein [Cobetia marina]|uniref:hypothetical protein n=1 Tax=Cobetia marina TaxID=28258 RepID=UPI0012F4AA8B|nr:hypothetical protein [Cobetia marina]
MFNIFWGKGKKEFSYIEPDVAVRKTKTKILFIDDQLPPVIPVLKSYGWINVHLQEDTNNLDEPLVSEAHIIFVDIQGVGKALKFENEGLGLVSALKEKYPEKKVVVYSAESEGDRFAEELEIADKRINKTVVPYRYVTLIEEYSKEIFTLDYCVSCMRSSLEKEFNIKLSKDEVIKNLQAVHRKGGYSQTNFSKVFNIGNAGSIATIAGLFLQ